MPHKPSNLQSRRAFFCSTAAFASSSLAGWAQESKDAAEIEKTAAELLTPETKRAIEKGLSFLASRQKRNGPDKGSFQGGGYSGSVAISALAGLAFMSAGNTPGIGQYGKEVDRCADFVSKNCDPKGFLSNDPGGGHANMYGHGFATLFLSQAYGMTRKANVGESLKKAVGLIVGSQNKEGGWRYSPDPNQIADLSVTVCQIMALRAARDAGINVPDKVREKCINYVKKSQNRDGSFRYMQQGGNATFALTAAGVVSLFSAGIYDTPEIERALRYLERNRNEQSSFFYYGHYYAVQAMWHAGGKWWNKWYPFIRKKLVDVQDVDGSWRNGNYGNEYNSAMACIILQMPNDLLPIFAK